MVLFKYMYIYFIFKIDLFIYTPNVAPPGPPLQELLHPILPLPAHLFPATVMTSLFFLAV